MVGNAVYKGELEARVPNGEGELLIDGITYKGNWTKGKLDKVDNLISKEEAERVQLSEKTSILVDETRVYIGELSKEGLPNG